MPERGVVIEVADGGDYYSYQTAEYNILRGEDRFKYKEETLSLSLSLSLGPLHAPLPYGAVRPHARAGLNPLDPDPVGSEGPEGLRSKGRVGRTMYIRVNSTMYILWVKLRGYG